MSIARVNGEWQFLTASRLKAARACLRKHQTVYILGYRSTVEADVLRFGSLVHRGLEGWWVERKNGVSAACLDAALAAMAGEADPFDRARAEEMMLGYDARWIGEPLDVLAVEAEFRAPLINPATDAASRTFRLGGKVDAIIRDGEGRVMLVEHKTSSEDIGQGSTYWSRLRMDGQVSIYFDGAKALGFDVEGCLYDVLGKPGLKPLKATPPESRKYTKDGALYKTQRLEDETAEEFRVRVRESIAADPNGHYQRGVVVRLEDEMDEARFDVWQMTELVRNSERTGKAPRNPDSCFTFGRACEFFPVCSGESVLDDPRIYKRSDHVHPELVGMGSTTISSREESTDGSRTAVESAVE